MMATTPSAAASTAAAPDLALLGNCTISALVNHAGAVVWCWMPRFDSTRAFDALLNSAAGLPLEGAIFEVLLARCNPVGILSEDFTPASGELWGNFPQSYSMVVATNGAVRLQAPWDSAV